MTRSFELMRIKSIIIFQKSKFTKIYRKWARMKNIRVFFYVAQYHIQKCRFTFSAKYFANVNCQISNAHERFEFGWPWFLVIKWHSQLKEHIQFSLLLTRLKSLLTNKLLMTTPGWKSAVTHNDCVVGFTSLIVHVMLWNAFGSNLHSCFSIRKLYWDCITKRFLTY